jgi:hypothetical protein
MVGSRYLRVLLRVPRRHRVRRDDGERSKNRSELLIQ